MGLYAVWLSRQIINGNAASTRIIRILTLILQLSRKHSNCTEVSLYEEAPTNLCKEITQRGPWIMWREDYMYPWSAPNDSRSLVFKLQPSSNYNCMKPQKHRAKSFLHSWPTGIKGDNKIIIVLSHYIVFFNPFCWGMMDMFKAVYI